MYAFMNDDTIDDAAAANAANADNADNAAIKDEESLEEEEDGNQDNAVTTKGDNKEPKKKKANNGDVMTMFQVVWETCRVTKPKTWVCVTLVVLEIVFFFPWPTLLLVNDQKNSRVEVIFLIVGFFSFLRRFWNVSTILSELGKVAVLIIQIHDVFLSQMMNSITFANDETACSQHIKGLIITSAKKKSVLYSGQIPTELNDGIINTTLDTTLDEASLPVDDESFKCDDAWEGVVLRCKQHVRVVDAKTKKALITARRWQPENVKFKEIVALVTIQCFARVICANNKALALLDEYLKKEEEEAAIILQSWIRQILARWQLLALRRNLENEAAITLQCFARVLSANKKALLLLDEVLDKEEEAATIVLQCWWRRQLLKKERDVGTIASTTLEYYKDDEEMIASVKIIQAATDYHKKHIDAAIVLQCFARVLVSNQRAALLLDELLDQEEEKAAIVIQRACVRRRRRMDSRLLIDDTRYESYCFYCFKLKNNLGLATRRIIHLYPAIGVIRKAICENWKPPTKIGVIRKAVCETWKPY